MIITLIILALLALSFGLVWPELSREIDAMEARAWRQIDDEDERRRSL